jgi:succinate dehydrogenase / fumarate reductase cytochrome b subunit
MAITGFLLFLFILIHMAGNWQLFLGAEAINSYAALLKEKAIVLWSFRLGLLFLITLHIWAALSLTFENRAAHPEKYEVAKDHSATLASRSMAVSGTIVLFFIIYHLLHFTARVAPGTQDYYLEDLKGRHDVYEMVVRAFQNPLITAFYVLGIGLLALHLSHGLQSMFRSLGLSNQETLPWQKCIARLVALGIFVGMVAIPLSVHFGCIK